MSNGRWPQLPADEWHDTLETVHRWSQVVGKVRMSQSPWLNHSWNVTLYVTPIGLTTGFVPYGREAFELSFDLERARFQLVTSTGRREGIDLYDGLSVAAFYEWLMSTLVAVGMPVKIDTRPNEVADAVPFPDDEEHCTYIAAHAHALHRALLETNRVFGRFRAGFRGKASPVHFFWGSFDLAVTRFSGRPAPTHPGGPPNFPLDVAAEAYSHEVTSVGFWPGSREAPTPIFYAYAYPTPDGYADALVEPEEASWLTELGEFALAYDAVANSPDPDATLLRFCETTHAAAAELAGWDRTLLECAHPHGPDWWAQRPHPADAAAVSTDPVTVQDDADRHRYVVVVDRAPRGEAVYQRRDDRWLLVHTEIDEAYDGRGLGSTLVRGALDDVRSQGGRVVPLCPFVAGWIEHHPEYDELVDHQLLAALTMR